MGWCGGGICAFGCHTIWPNISSSFRYKHLIHTCLSETQSAYLYCNQEASRDAGLWIPLTPPHYIPFKWYYIPMGDMWLSRWRLWRMLAFVLWRCVALYRLTDVSGKPNSFLLRAEIILFCHNTKRLVRMKSCVFNIKVKKSVFW